MIFNLQRILRSKRSARDRFAQEPVIRKLRVLDRLREREIAIRTARGTIRRDRENAHAVDNPPSTHIVNGGKTSRS